MTPVGLKISQLQYSLHVGTGVQWHVELHMDFGEKLFKADSKRCKSNANSCCRREAMASACGYHVVAIRTPRNDLEH